MSPRERQYLQVIGRIKHSDIKVSQAAEILGLSDRQMYRLLLRYDRKGDRGLIPRPRGRASNRGYPRRCTRKFFVCTGKRTPICSIPHPPDPDEIQVLVASRATKPQFHEGGVGKKFSFVGFNLSWDGLRCPGGGGSS
jgi:hypothetical protein